MSPPTNRRLEAKRRLVFRIVGDMGATLN